MIEKVNIKYKIRLTARSPRIICSQENMFLILLILFFMAYNDGTKLQAGSEAVRLSASVTGWATTEGHSIYSSRGIAVDGKSAKILASEVSNWTPCASATNSQSYAEHFELAVKLNTCDEVTSYSPPCIKSSASCMKRRAWFSVNSS